MTKSRYDVSYEEVNRVVVALLTAESQEARKQYMLDTFPSVDESYIDELKSLERLWGMILWDLLAAFDQLRRVPAWRRHIEQFLRSRALIRERLSGGDDG